jgi:hypothetical protein
MVEVLTIGEEARDRLLLAGVQFGRCCAVPDGRARGVELVASAGGDDYGRAFGRRKLCGCKADSRAAAHDEKALVR